MTAVFGILAVIAGAIWNGFVLSVMWGWFIVPTFNAPALTVPAAIGIALVFDMLTGSAKSDSEDTSFGKILFYHFAFPLILLPVGWLVQNFM